MSSPERASALSPALVLGLSAGAVDVCVGLLNKPRGFEGLASLPPPILATTAVAVPLYFACWALIGPLAKRLGFDRSATLWSLAAFLGTTFTLILLGGLHTLPATPQLLFKIVVALSLALVTSAGVYSLSLVVRRNPRVHDGGALVVLALPLLLFDVLLYQWVQVYAIDRVASIATVLALVVFAIVGAATLGTVHQLRRRWPAARVLATFALVLLVGAIAGPLSARRPATVQASTSPSGRVPERIILITVDTLRADALSSYRAAAPRTSAIDRLAGDGVVFEHAVAPAPWTLPSLVSIVTGLLPAAHRATGFTSTVSPTITTLAKYLHDRGYQTAAIVHNDLLNPKNGLSEGFAEYVSLHEQWFGDSLGMKALQAAAPTWFPPLSWPTNDDQTKVVTEWLESNRDRNFFLWMHYFDPHAPYAPPREYRIAEPHPAIGGAFDGPKMAMQGFFVPSVEERQAIRSLYDGEVRYVDANIGRVIATLERLRLYDGSLIVFTSDHGEEFWEHGRAGHGHSLYDELLRVPLIVKLPGAKARGRSSAVVSTASVTPTILDASGIRYDEGNMSAPSLLPLLETTRGDYTSGPIVSNAQILFDLRRVARRYP
jgi:arylsulfatase A-like enzyme